jgi:5'-3' exonuclease
MDVHLIDGIYELFRHFFAVPTTADMNGQEVGAVRGVLNSVLSMIERGAFTLGLQPITSWSRFGTICIPDTRPARPELLQVKAEEISGASENRENYQESKHGRCRSASRCSKSLRYRFFQFSLYFGEFRDVGFEIH